MASVPLALAAVVDCTSGSAALHASEWQAAEAVAFALAAPVALGPALALASLEAGLAAASERARVLPLAAEFVAAPDAPGL